MHRPASARVYPLLFVASLAACREAPKKAEPQPLATPSASGSRLLLDPSVLGPVRSRAGGEPTPVVGAAGDEAVHAVGDRGDARDYGMTVLGTRPCKLEPHFSPREGNFKLGVEVEIEGRSDREVPVSAFYALLMDAEGNLYRPTLAGCTPSLPSERVREGESVKGFITFELPDAARGLRLSYEPFVLGAGEQRLMFSLGS
jgi:hypothetical protein